MPKSPSEITYSLPTLAAILGISDRRAYHLKRSGAVSATWQDGRPGCMGGWRVTRGEIERFIKASESEHFQRRLATYFTRERLLTTAEAAELLEVKPGTVWWKVQKGQLVPEKLRHGYANRFTRQALIRHVRARFKGNRRAELLARMRDPAELVVMATRDVAVRRGLAEWGPLSATSMFALGRMTAESPAWLVVVDWELAGMHEAHEAAARLIAAGETPLLVGIAPEDFAGRGFSKSWDVILTRPVTATNLAACVRQLAAIPNRRSQP